MAKGAGENNPDQKSVTAAGIVEAIEQDVELSIEQAKGAAKEAVATVKEKLGVGKPRARKPPPMKMKPRATMVAKKTVSKAIKSSKPAKASQASKVSKASQASKGKSRTR
jgi:hypothetical protein